MHLVILVKGRKVPVGSRSRSGRSVKVAEGVWRPVRSQLPKAIASKVKVPPAWTNVRYSADPNARILVKGEDAKGRTQYLYNPDHVEESTAAKFSRIRALNRKYKQVVAENAENLKRGSEPAMVLALVLATGIRPGSEKKTKGEVEAFGATTLLGRHVKDNGTRLEFTGKKGVALSIPVPDSTVARLLWNRKKKAGAEGRLFNVTGDQLLRYTWTLGDNAGFQTKDFRTHLGTQTAMEAMRKIKAPTNMKEYKKAVVRVADAVAEKLGNTRAVALQSYVNPAIFEKWRSNVEGA